MSDEKRDRGRPKLPAPLKRKPWSLSLTDAERAKIEHSAGKKDPSVWARETLLEAAR